MSSSKRLRSSSGSESGVTGDESDDSLQTNAKQNGIHSSKCSQRLMQLFVSEDMADVAFNFEDIDQSKPIKAHSLILCCASDVFRQMFDNYDQKNLINGQLMTIEVRDCDYYAFERVIQYLYSDRIEINDANVMPIISAAKKFGVESVIDVAVSFACKQLNRNNCFDWFTKASDLDECKLKHKCLEMIANNAQYVINSDAFLKLTNSQLCEIVARDDLFVDEYDLFNAVIRWCETSNKDESFRNSGFKLRDIMADAFNLIRFPIMTFSNFCRILQVFSDLFTHEEMIAIIEYINIGTNGTNLRFPTKKRTNLY